MNILNTQVIETSRFAMVSNRLISRNLPPNVLSEKEFKRLLHIWATINTTFGNTYNGHNAFRKLVPCSESEYHRIMARLQEMNFIKAQTKTKTITYVYAMIMPLYDHMRNQFIVTDDEVLTGTNYKLLKEHFTIVPAETLIKSLELPVQDIRVLLKLYKYNNYNLFRGIDPNAICIDKNDRWIVNPRIAFDLFITDDELFSSIDNLIAKGFIAITETILTVEKFDYEERLMPAKDSSGTKVKLLTPIYQYKNKKRERIPCAIQ